MAAPLVRPARSGLLFRSDTAPGRVRFGARLSRLFDENWCLETLGSKGRSEANPMRTRSRGLGPGSRQALERWNLFARLEMHGAARHVLQNGPFLAFGNHPAGVEVAFFNALLDREDVFFLGGAHVPQ